MRGVSRGFFFFFHHIVLQEHVVDKWQWLLELVIDYSVNNVCHFLINVEEPSDRLLAADIWNKQVPMKVSLFV